MKGNHYEYLKNTGCVLSDEWKALIVEDTKTKEKLVIINEDCVEITSPDLNVRLIPKN